MSLSLKEALLEARNCPFGGVLVFDGKGYEVEELPEGAVIIVPQNGDLPIALSREADDNLKTMLKQAIKGLLTRPAGKKIKRRV